MKDNLLELYARDIDHIPLLSREEEINLAKRIANGDEKAKEKMICSNLRLVIRIARDYERLGLPLADLIAEGNVGLMRATEKFDPSFGAKFSTYAAFWIKQGIRRAISDQSRTIRIPVHMLEKIHKLSQEEIKMAHAQVEEPSREALMAATGLTDRQITLADRSRFSTVSLDAASSQEEGSDCWHERVEDKTSYNPADKTGLRELIDQLQQLLNTLTPRERDVISRRYGLGEREPETLEEISSDYGLSRERIRQIQNIALKNLRQALRKKERSSQPIPMLLPELVA